MIREEIVGGWMGGYLFYTRAGLNEVGLSPTRPVSSDWIGWIMCEYSSSPWGPRRAGYRGECHPFSFHIPWSCYEKRKINGNLKWNKKIRKWDWIDMSLRWRLISVGTLLLFKMHVLYFLIVYAARDCRSNFHVCTYLSICHVKGFPPLLLEDLTNSEFHISSGAQIFSYAVDSSHIFLMVKRPQTNWSRTFICYVDLNFG
jgi:hypothetical protein